MKKSFRSLSRAYACMALLSFPLCAYAQTNLLSNGNFNAGLDGWAANGSTQSAVNSASDPASGLDGGALRHVTTSNAATNGIHYAQFAATTLAKAGDTITMSFDFMGTATAYQNNNKNLFDFGLLGSTSSTFAIADTFGYGMSMRLEEDARASTMEPTARVMNGAVLSTTTFAADSSTGTAFSLYGGENGNRTDRLSFTFSITRQADDGLSLTAFILNETTEASFTRTYSIAAADLQNSSDDPYTFDTIFIGFLRAGTMNSIFDIDNVSVTFISVIPEPATVGVLLGLGCAVLALVCRRKRQ